MRQNKPLPTGECKNCREVKRLVALGLCWTCYDADLTARHDEQGKNFSPLLAPGSQPAQILVCARDGCEKRVRKLVSQDDKSFCSIRCANRARHPLVEATCARPGCGVVFRYPPSQKRKYHSHDCYAEAIAGTGEGWITPQGYRMISQRRGVPSRFEHSIMFEEILGRRLTSTENVHHKNGDRADNRTDGPPRMQPDGKLLSGNLELWSSKQPRGQEIGPKLDWATEMVATYGTYLDDARWEALEAAMRVARAGRMGDSGPGVVEQ